MDERYPRTDRPRAVSVIRAPEDHGPEAGVSPSSGVDSGRSGWAPELRVRPAMTSDVASIVALEKASFSDPWSAASFCSSLSRPETHMTVAEWRGEGPAWAVVGYMVAWFIGQEGEIANIAVDSTWQRRGVGAALLDEVLASGQVAGVESMYLEVRASNVAAQALYASRGFSAVGMRRRYYSDPSEDALVLKWERDP